MQSYPLDLATILYILGGQSGRLQARLGEVPGTKEPGYAYLVLAEGKVVSAFLETRQGALIAQGERAMDVLTGLGVINWLWEPGLMITLHRPDGPASGNRSFIPQRSEPFKSDALAACSRVQRRVLGLVDGRRTTQEIATLLAVPPAEFERLLAVLRELQVLGLIALD